MRALPVCALIPICLFVLQPVAEAADVQDEHTLKLYTRARVENTDNDGRFDVVYKTVQWDARKTAIVICDMWNEHWCKGATGRVTEMAPRMNQVIGAARDKDVLVIHAPSGTMDAYEGTPGRELAQQAPKVETVVPLAPSCRLDPDHEAPMPVDASDGGCDCQPPCPKGRPWTRQIDTLDIEPGDAITDSNEAFRLIADRGIENVILMGVHANMCVLARPFAIRQMVAQGKNVLLIRDMTDAMYNSRKEPHVSHVRGTELVVEHIEKYWCATITSADFLGSPAFRFSEDNRPHLAIIVSDDHYGADKTLPRFAQLLRRRYGLHVSVLHGQGTADIPATDELESADCVLLFIRRLALPKPQLDRFRRYLASGKPLVALRTASHAFSLRGKPGPDGTDQWPEFDAEVLGGNYHGHGSNDLGTDVSEVPEKSDHPIMAGVDPKRWHSTGSLYNVSPIAADATVLMTGAIGDEVVEPLTWTRTYRGGRVFYSGLGHPDDFGQPQFVTLLVNAIHWAMDRPVPKPLATPH